MSAPNADRRIALWLLAGILLLIVLVSLVAPATREDDPVPSSYNTGTHGAKAAYLLLGALGYTISRADSPATALDQVDAPHTTYILAGPNAPSEDREKEEYAAVERFLQRGGRVVATGFRGAYFLPGGRTGAPTQFLSGLCQTTGEGWSVYGAVDSLAMYDQSPWAATEPLVHVDQRCGNDAVVVHRSYPNGGEFVWWASAEPLTNRGIAQDSSLKLLLASVGPSGGSSTPRILFDEFYHGEQGAPSDYLRGLPLRSLMVQASLLFLLLLLSFSRRKGPLQEPVLVPRTSPIEFARNMGALYQRAGATQPATEAARRRLLSFLHTECGIPSDVLTGSARGIAAAVQSRFAAETDSLERALDLAEEARYEKLRPRDALHLVHMLSKEREHLAGVLRARSAGKLIVETPT